jgi:hypothetical protein
MPKTTANATRMVESNFDCMDTLVLLNREMGQRKAAWATFKDCALVTEVVSIAITSDFVLGP